MSPAVSKSFCHCGAQKWDGNKIQRQCLPNLGGQGTAEHLDVSNFSESHAGHWCWGTQACQHLKMS